MLGFVTAVFVSILIAHSDCQCGGSRSSGNYIASWSVNAGGSTVQFNVSVPTSDNTWVAIGFSASGSMLNSDIVIASSDGSGQSFVEDRWAITTLRQMPTYDKDQDIKDTSVSFINGTMNMSFVRDIYTTKVNDYRLDRCVYVLAAWGGQVTSYSSPSMFSKHSNKEVIMQLICLQSCPGYIPPVSPSSSVSATSSSSIPAPTTSDNSSSGLSTPFIIMIVVLVSLVLVAVLLFLILGCICLINKHSSKRTTYIYELDNAPPPHPAIRRETMEKQPESFIDQPHNDYQEEEVVEQHLYDDVTREVQRVPEVRPDSFYEGQTEYDQPPRDHQPTEPTQYYDNQYFPPEKTTKKEDAFEHMQYDGIRHILQ